MTGLRVLHVIPSLSAADGGPTRAVLMMEKVLSRLGVDVTILTTDHEIDTAATAALLGDPSGKRVHCPLWSRPYKVAPGMVPFLARHLGEFDAVHIHALFSFASTAAALAAQHQRVPYIVRPLGTLATWGVTTRRPRLKKFSIAMLEGPILRRAAAVHFTSDAEEQQARALGLSFESAVIPLGVAEVASSASARPALPTHLVGRHFVLYLSRLDPKKNIENLIDAFAGSDVLRRDCALVVAGSGEPGYVAGLEARAATTGIAELVVWPGHVDGEAKAALLSQADVFVLPSFSENFGIAAVEALLAGKAAVLSPGVAIAAETAAAGGAVVAGPDAESLRQALERLASDEALRARIGGGGRAFARSSYSVEATGRRLVELYRKVRATAA